MSTSEEDWHIPKSSFILTIGKYSGKSFEEVKRTDISYCNCYCDRTFPTEYGCQVHERSCKSKRKPSFQARQPARNDDVCYRCGREGHYAPDCYASRHIRGYDLD